MNRISRVRDRRGATADALVGGVHAGITRLLAPAPRRYCRVARFTVRMPNPRAILEGRAEPELLAAATRRDDLVAAYGRYNREVEVQARDALARFLG